MHFVFLKLFSFFCFISAFVSLGFPSSGNLFFFIFEILLLCFKSYFSYSNLILKIRDLGFKIHS